MRRVHVQDGFLILLAVLWAADTTGALPLFLFAAAVHEAGHLLMLRLSGGHLRKLSLTACGAVLHCALPDSPFARTAVCLMGPAASFALAALAETFGAYRLAGASALLGLFNLLPMPPLDGGMALAHICAGRFPLARSVISALTGMALLSAGFLLARQGGGIWLTAVGTAACARAFLDRREEQRLGTFHSAPP